MAVGEIRRGFSLAPGAPFCSRHLCFCQFVPLFQQTASPVHLGNHSPLVAYCLGGLWAKCPALPWPRGQGSHPTKPVTLNFELSVILKVWIEAEYLIPGQKIVETKSPQQWNPEESGHHWLPWYPELPWFLSFWRPRFSVFSLVLWDALFNHCHCFFAYNQSILIATQLLPWQCLLHWYLCCPGPWSPSCTGRAAESSLLRSSPNHRLGQKGPLSQLVKLQAWCPACHSVSKELPGDRGHVPTTCTKNCPCTSCSPCSFLRSQDWVGPVPSLPVLSTLLFWTSDLSYLGSPQF